MTTKTFAPALGAKLNKPPIVFLHGFPGIKSQQNVELAQRVADRTGRDCTVLFYSGLGKAPGDFTFNACLREVSEFFAQLFETVSGPIDLVGHSWGGFLALQIASRNHAMVRRLTLISPLIDFHPVEQSEPSFQNHAHENPRISLGNIRERSLEFLSVSAENPAPAAIMALSHKLQVLYLQSRTDEVTPTAVAERTLKQFPCNVEFKLIETDHSFLTLRDEVSTLIADFAN